MTQALTRLSGVLMQCSFARFAASSSSSPSQSQARQIALRTGAAFSDPGGEDEAVEATERRRQHARRSRMT
jgi:hypothetical protein